MRKLKVIINRMSGNGSKAYLDKVVSKLETKFNEKFEIVQVISLADENDMFELDGCDAVAVCGGDGTLSNALNKAREFGIDVFYFPYGTLNELAKHIAKVGGEAVNETGFIGDRQFVYVAATGSFTPIGYSTTNKSKRKLKFFAYVLRVLKEYKVYNMKATIDADGVIDSGEYSLIMCLDSRRCFSFNFNRLYKFNDGKFHLLTIKTPKGAFKKFKIFFPLFRAFFIGFNKEYKSKNMIFKAAEKVKISYDKDYPICLDGEKYYAGTEYEVKIDRSNSRIFVII
ncbi:MAG: diacylglycerol kinase family protein [Eubacteriales bacterium]|nr:diacylglycerol kinase family protein [Eubacteriales bacterium]